MTLRWCVLTGALMLASVFATFTFKNVVQDTPGVYTRWYDGTTQRVDVFWPNGKLKSTTTYGDDGKTVLILVELTDEGAIVHSKVRRQDGKVLEKRYSEDGKVMLFQTLWSGDGTFFLEQRQYYPDGTLKNERIMTEDGAAPVSIKMFQSDGSLMLERHILNNADQEERQYQAGKLISRSVFKANADMISEMYRPDTGTIFRRVTTIALTKDSTLEFFDKDGVLVYSSFRQANSNNMVNTVYSHGKIVLRQTGADFLITAVEEFTPGATKSKRKLELDANGKVIAAYIYRNDGTLAQVKHLSDGVVTSEDDYDASGTRVIRKLQGGEPETIDPKLLLPALPPREEE